MQSAQAPAASGDCGGVAWHELVGWHRRSAGLQRSEPTGVCWAADSADRQVSHIRSRASTKQATPRTTRAQAASLTVECCESGGGQRSICLPFSKRVRIDRSASTRTKLTGESRSLPTASWSVGSWCWRRADGHHRNSVFPVFSWSRFDRIQSATAAMQSVTRRCRWLVTPGRHEP